MLEKTPAAVGHFLKSIRPGLEKLVYADDRVYAAETIVIDSPAFEADGPLPPKFTEDGEKTSPPLAWRGVPPEAKAVILVAEDADSPTPVPLLHLIAYDLPTSPESSFGPGAFNGEGGQVTTLGKNSFGKTGWLPPDPPTGHGPHRYVFQVFALDHRPDLSAQISKHDALEAIRGHVLARGHVVTTYERAG